MKISAVGLKGIGGISSFLSLDSLRSLPKRVNTITLLPRVENYPDFVSLSGFRITVSAAGRSPAHAPAGSADLGGRGGRRPPHSPEGALTVMQ